MQKTFVEIKHLSNNNNFEIDSESDKSDEDEKVKNKKVIEINDKGLPMITCEVRELFEHQNDPYGILHKGSVRMIINGKSGSGKSCLLRCIVPMLKKPTHLIICTTVVGNDVHEGIKKYCKVNKIKFALFLTPQEFLETMSKLVEEKERDDHIICIFDDFTDCHTGKNNEFHNCTIRAFSKWRNYNISNIIISPDVSDIKTNIRNSSNIQILFPVENPYGHIEFKKILRNKFPYMSSEYWTKLYDYIQKHDYNFIMYTDTNKGKSMPHLRLNWDKIVYPMKPEKEKENFDDSSSESEAESSSESDGEFEVKEPPKKVDGRTLNKTHGRTFEARYSLLQEAQRLGIPKYLCTGATMEQLQNFIRYQKSKGVFKGSGDMALKIMGENKPSKVIVTSKLRRQVKRYLEKEDEHTWRLINETCNDLIRWGYMDKLELRQMLDRLGIDVEKMK